VTGAYGGVAERLGEEALADLDRTDEWHVLAAVEQLQRGGASSNRRTNLLRAVQSA